MFKVVLGIVAGVLITISVLLLIHKGGTVPALTNISNPLSSLAPISQTSQTAVTNDQLNQLASDKYSDGNLPLGDKKYVTDAPKKGYIYLCNTNQNGGGAQYNGPWIHGDTWNIKEKIAVEGKISWPNAQFSDTVSGDNRTLSGNDLPTGSTTGVFPIQSSDPAYQYDRNPNSIKTQSFSDTLPTNPTYSNTPFCINGEVGIMNNGVALFDGFDAEYRDAAAHELQDSCQGHPQESGEYHYHSLSSCINNANVSTVIGFALDGFPITGPTVSDGKYLTTDDLDECHGITSTINLDGKQVSMYHYVMTEDFPYSVSCFRGRPVTRMVIPESGSRQQKGGAPAGQQGLNSQMGGGQDNQQGGGQGTGQPPQEAITACSNSSQGSSCSFSTPNGTITGTCQTPPNQTSLICVPAR